MIHGFETEIATEVGIPAAIVLHNIFYWCKRNEGRGLHLHEGRHWMYCTQAEFAKQIPYLSERTLRRALTDLREHGLLLVANYNKIAFDRTCWYAPSDRALDVYANSDASCGQPDVIRPVRDDRDNTKSKPKEDIPPIAPQRDKPKPKKTAKPKPPADLALFNTFWQAYPKKVDKQESVEVWKKLNPSPELFETIMNGLNRSVAFDHRFRDRQYTPSPARWLRRKSWEDEFEMPKPTTTPPRNNAFDELRSIAKEKGAPPPEREWR